MYKCISTIRKECKNDVFHLQRGKGQIRVGWIAGNTSACVWKISNFSYD